MGRSKTFRDSDFDAAYYDRFYRDPTTRVADPRSVARLVGFVAGYLKHLQIPVTRILDIGCGLGLWQRPLAKAFPKASWLGVEFSGHICATHGFQQGSVVDFEADEPFDLVICQGVLQYLNAQDARRGIQNLGRLTRGALYLEALTERDWQENVSRETTDGATHLRPGSWYRKLLHKRFQNAGGGVFLHRDCDAVLFELEGPDETGVNT